ncbi:MAG: glycerophosphodiester phosphodiesterase [Acidobacteriota bacterium]|nr:glycerophosphodiester phosphodiesterase [Acidobacteriota bacterium]
MTRVFAHRGLHASARENTLEAFIAARDLGVDGVELDVRRSAEGDLVVHHDALVEGRAIARTPRAELPDYVPTLAQAVGACAGLTVNVEIKNLDLPGEPDYDASGGFARQVVDLLEAAAVAGTSQVSCFDLATCRAVRAAAPSLYVAWLVMGGDVAAQLGAAARAGLSALNPHFVAVDEAAVARAHELGLELNVWTVNARHDLAAMVALGVDALITDDPATALAEVLGPEGGPAPMA